jgi:hypothetical protein
MRNDSIETLLLRHYGSTAPAPVDLEEQLSTMVRQEASAELVRQEAISRWSERRVSRRRVLQLVTLSGAGLGALVVGVDTLQKTLTTAHTRKPAYAL